MTREEAIKLLKEFALRVKPFYEPQRTEYQQAIDMAIEALKAEAVQDEAAMTKQEILGYLDNVLHPIVSPDNWYVYSELHDMIEELPFEEPECGCKPKMREKTKYCPNCGAKMDMRGEDEYD